MWKAVQERTVSLLLDPLEGGQSIGGVGCWGEAWRKSVREPWEGSLRSLMLKMRPDNVDTLPQEGSSCKPQILSWGASKTSVTWPHPLPSNTPWAIQLA